MITRTASIPLTKGMPGAQRKLVNAVRGLAAAVLIQAVIGQECLEQIPCQSGICCHYWNDYVKLDKSIYFETDYQKGKNNYIILFFRLSSKIFASLLLRSEYSLSYNSSLFILFTFCSLFNICFINKSL